MQPADPPQADTAAVSATAPPSAADNQGDVSDEQKSSGALGALVKVGPVPGFNKCSGCHLFLIFFVRNGVN